MARRLAEIADNVDPKAFHWDNDQRYRHFRTQFSKAENLADAMRARILMADELLRSGRTLEAIREFDDLRRFFENPNVELDPASSKRIRDSLATCYVRAALQENCTGERVYVSCSIPVVSEGRHQAPRGAQATVVVLSKILKEGSGDDGHRWLFNLAYQFLGQYPDQVPSEWLIPPDRMRSNEPMPQFHAVTSEPDLMISGRAGGCVMDDFDGDGLLDVVATSWGLRDPMRFIRNAGAASGGGAAFSDRTRESGLDGQVGGCAVSQVDFDNDGDLDLLVLRGAWLFDFGYLPNSLLRNRGDGRFDDVTEDAGLLAFDPSTVGAWADYDNDGWVDLFVGNQSTPTDPHPCQLYHNNKDGTFTEVAAAADLAIAGFVSGSAWGDYNNDNRPDLYVSRYGEPNHLFRNDGPDENGTWRFSDVSSAARVFQPLFSQSVWFWDYDNDGWQDLFVAASGGIADYSLPDVAADYRGTATKGAYPRLFRNNHDGTFADVTRDAGLWKQLLAMGAASGDLDNDGFADVCIGTGEPDLRTLVPNRMFRNEGGRSFAEVTTAARFGLIQKGSGVALGDIDNDGDLDAYVVTGGFYSGDTAPNVLYENRSSTGHWLKLKLDGVASNRSAIGARVRVTVVDSDGSTREIHTAVTSGDASGGSSLQQEIGLGGPARIERVTITWPRTGKQQVLHGIEMDQAYRVREGSDRAERLDRACFKFRPIDAEATVPEKARATTQP